MTPTHHLTPELITAYAAGSLTEAQNLIVATHISMCDACRADLAAAEALGGAVLTTAPQAALAPGSLEAALRLIDSAPQMPAPRPQAPQGGVPAPLRAYLAGGYDQIRWSPVGGGVSQHRIRTQGPGSVRLLRIPGGVSVPEHSHRGLELTLVLEGAFADETDRFGPGDIEVADDDLDHQPVAEPGADCICLAATEGALRFRGLLPRLAQPFIGI